MSKLEITKQVPLSKQLYSAVEARIEQLGLKFPEYIRHLILVDTKMVMDNIPYVTRQEELDIAASLRDIRKGRFTELKSDKEIDEYFEKLTEEANE